MAEPREPENFYLRWAWRTVNGPWGVAGFFGSFLSLAIPAVVRLVPDLRDVGAEMNDLTWVVPLSIFGALAVVRFFIAPMSIWRDERRRADVLQEQVAAAESHRPVLVAKATVQQEHYDMVNRDRGPNDPVLRRTGHSFLLLAVTNDTPRGTDSSIARDVVAFIQFTRPALAQVDAVWSDPDRRGHRIDSRAVIIGVGQTQHVIVALRGFDGRLTTVCRRDTRPDDLPGTDSCIVIVRLRGPFVDHAWTMEFVGRAEFDIEVIRCEPLLPAPAATLNKSGRPRRACLARSIP